jgi:hypothetical protein
MDNNIAKIVDHETVIPDSSTDSYKKLIEELIKNKLIEDFSKELKIFLKN